MRISISNLKATASLGGMAICLLSSIPALAQDAATAPAEAEEEVAETITVTGSRVKRDGFQAPTPETVIGADAIENAAQANIADLVNDFPAVAGSSTPRTATVNASSGSAGSNFLNLRGLGTTRTLVLLDGRRVVGATTDGVVDINTLPTALVNRIDIVTGGASAAYGSDAVSGVANFILDTKFKGVKGQIQTGVTDYGDGFKWKAELSGGTDFADGRGHVLLSGSYSKADGVTELTSRPWFQSQKIIPNPAFVAGNGQPRLLSASNVNIVTASVGGVILNGALRGTSFGTGGAQQNFNFGTFGGNLTGTNYGIGGTHSDLADFWQLEIPLEQSNVFGRFSYDVSDSFKPYVEASYSKAIADSQGPLNFRIGNVTIQRDNAFLPDNLRQTLMANNQTNFLFGTLIGDLPRQNPHNVREMKRIVVGADGDFGGSWSYSLSGQYGRTDVSVDLRNALRVANFGRAIDAIRVGGQIVCRVNGDTNTTNDDAACVPFNPFGTGVNSSAAAQSYVTGTSQLRQKLEQTVVAGSVQGEPFSTWAGPVSVVFGAEYRKEQVASTNDAQSQANIFIAGNYKATNGSYDIKEVFGEIVVPLAKDKPFFQNLELNGAVRHTDYSTSGTVQTWKAGLNWSPVEDLRLRGTVSRDIRAPNLNDLFQAGITSAAQSAIIPAGGIPGLAIAVGGSASGFTGVAIGNPNLSPERADSFTVGGVYQPSWLPGLSLSVDYYSIKIKDALVVSTTQQVFNRCAAGNLDFCADIFINTAGTAVTSINRVPRNFANEAAKGLDIEARYTRELGDGNISARVLATHFITRTLSDDVSTDQSAGENTGGIPDWRIVTSVGYDSKTWGANLTTRTVSSGVYDKAFTSAVLADNSLPGATYVDLGFVFKFEGFGSNAEFFFNVDNLFNKDPAIVPPQAQQFIVAPVNASLYDTLGREYRAGFRFKF